MATYNTFEVSGNKNTEQDEDIEDTQFKNSKHVIYLRRIIYALLAIIVVVVILLIVSIFLMVDIYRNSNNGDDIISVDSISDLDSYLSDHCVLHRDVFDGEREDGAGEGMTVIRNPTKISLPINIAYSPLRNNITGDIEYFDNLDIAGNLVPRPLCQTDFDTSTYTMKDNSYIFDSETCQYPLPAWMNETDILNLPRRYQPITHHITLTTVEVVAELEEGHTFEFFTYNATVPGPPLRVRVGDWIDLTLINPNTSIHEHSVDFHAMSGLDGGAASLRADPGQRARTIWQAIFPGMFIYHCASGWVSDHISKGMYGAIIVEPEYGLPYSDMDIYIGQNEIYLHFPLVNNINTGFQRPPGDLHNIFDPIKERYEMSDVVMMNGAPFALLHNPVTTTVGSIVRLFMVSGGPNHVSSFHLIGDSFDRVWLHGDLSLSPQQNVQTTTVPPGGCTVVDWRHDTPGSFVFVDHSLTRAFVRGNLGIIHSCDVNDDDCLSGTKKENFPALYTCNPDRYNADDMDLTYIGNDDCIFCPWNRDDFSYSTVYDETDEIYNYLNSKCNISDRIHEWQGNESLHNDTYNDIRNQWRKNRYPGSLQWSLSERLSTADPMIGNKRTGPKEEEDEDFDSSPCIFNIGALEIEYSMQLNGQSEIKISSSYNNVINGGWISFGRGGDGISAMIDAHVHTVLFNYDLNDIQFVPHYVRDFGIPLIDDSNEIFPVYNGDLIVTQNDDKISFNFNVESGDWINPAASHLTTVPMVVAIGELSGNRDTAESDDMIKHFSNHVVYIELTAPQCLLGGTKL